MPRPLSEYQDNIAAEMLEDLEELTGVSIGEMLADELPEFEEFPVYEEPEEGEELDMDSDAGDADDYFDEIFDDLDLTGDEEDSYGDD